MKAPLLLAAVLALVTGCESTAHYNRTKVVMLGPQLPARPLGSVPLFQSKEEVPEPYKVFALMSVEGRAGEEAQFIKAFLYRAADLGADGLILYRVALAAGPEGGGWIAGNGGGIGAGYNTRHEAVYRGEAIRWHSNTNVAAPAADSPVKAPPGNGRRP